MSGQVEFFDVHDEPLGTVTLLNGKLSAPKHLEEITRVTVLDAKGKAMQPSEGETYLKALAEQFQSGYLSARYSAGETK